MRSIVVLVSMLFLAPGALSALDEPDTVLLVPFFEVDTTSAAGTTTLFAVRNRSAGPTVIDVTYFSREGLTLAEESRLLQPEATFTRNVRDVAGLEADPDGFARGFVSIQSPEPMTGDFFQVDVGNDFATGERLVRLDDLCQEAEVRFLDFGSGTVLQLLINSPRGDDPESDPPSFLITVLDEDGTPVATVVVHTDEIAPGTVLTTSDLGGLASGTLVFDFSNSGGGWVYGEYGAEGRFSVGLNGACLTP